MFFTLFLTIYIIHKLISPIRKSDHYWDGPTPTRREQERNKKAAFKIIEEFPDGVFATMNPEYKEEYLQSIDLELPPGIKLQS